MVVTSEIKKGLDITITTGATESHPAGKSNPTISLQQYFENVNSLPEFTKRIPIDLVLNDEQNSSSLESDAAYLSIAEKYRDGTATEEEMEQLRNMNGQKNTANDGGVKYSIAVLPDGVKYVVLDGNVFLNSDGTEMTPRQAYNALIGQRIVLEDGDTLTFIKKLPEVDLFKELFRKFPSYSNISDIKAVNEIANKNIVDILSASSAIGKNIPQRHYHAGVVNFDKRSVLLFDGNTAYRLDISVANLTDGGKIAYSKDYVKQATAEEIEKIKRAETARKISRESTLKNSIRSSEANVNPSDEKNTAEDGVKYKLKQYTDRQISNWSISNKIVVFTDNQQLLDFVHSAVAGENLSKKMYFGEVDGVLAARIKKETGLDVEGRNVTLRAGNIRKILLHSHGNQSKEALRGQRAVVDNDFVKIPDVIESPTTISSGQYENRPAIVFEKIYSNERWVVFAVDSGKSSLDLFVQTMYINEKKGSIANVANAQTLALTSKTTVGTAPNSIIRNAASKSNTSKESNSSRNQQSYEEIKKQSAERLKNLRAEKNAQIDEVSGYPANSAARPISL